MRLAPLGYRPVPLYNAAPGPKGTLTGHMGIQSASLRIEPTSAPPPPEIGPETLPPLPIALVNVWNVVNAIAGKTALLKSLALPLDASPAFLLDADRRLGLGAATPGRFDNRSISFPTDFPSANLILSCGYRRAVLIQGMVSQPQPDLAHTLRRWQEAGVGISIRIPEGEGFSPPQPIDVRRPSAFRSLWYALLVKMGLKKYPLGGFGGMVPHPSSG